MGEILRGCVLIMVRLLTGLSITNGRLLSLCPSLSAKGRPITCGSSLILPASYGAIYDHGNLVL